MRILLIFLLMALPVAAGNIAPYAQLADSRRNIQGAVAIYSATWVDSSSSAISKIYDWSGNNYFATQTTANRKPTLVTNQLSGWPVIATDGTNNVMVITNATISIFAPNNNSNCTAIFVLLSTNTYGNTVFAPKVGSATTTYEALVGFLDGNIYGDFGNNTTARRSAAGNSTNASVWIMSRTGGNGFMYKNGATIYTFSGMTTGAALTTNEMALFADLQTGTPITQLRGILPEIIFLNRGITAQEATNWTRFIAARYNITVQ